MQLSVDGEWVDGARRVLSPNCDSRPEDCDISLIVVHGISLPPGEYGGPWIDDLFSNRLDAGAHPYFTEIAGLEVSSHVLIRRDGEVVQYVPFSKRAWHAGLSSYQGRDACNDYAVGIELEGQDDEPYEAVQYQRLAELITALRGRFPAIGAEAVVGHCDVAPGRKSDPGKSFDWTRLKSLLA
jgi:AmpD protein